MADEECAEGAKGGVGGRMLLHTRTEMMHNDKYFFFVHVPQITNKH